MKFRPGYRDETDDPTETTLELRIHGIKNTPPTEMLERNQDDIVPDRGDDLGGFWRERQSTGPAGVRREAYSWGALARSDGGALAGIGQLFVHIGWFLLLPFGLVNVAYWTRKIPDQPDAGWWHGGLGAGFVRVFGLGLTLVYVMALATASIELVGVQCYRSTGLCSGLPEQLASLVGLPRAARLAVFALVPLVGVLLLYLLSSRARARYEANVELMTAEPTKSLAWPVLASRGFWRRARVKAGTERLHLAASAFLLAAMLAWDHAFSPYPACEDPDQFFSAACRQGGPLTALPWTTVFLVAAIAGVVIVVVLIGPGSPGRVIKFRNSSSLWILIASAVVLGGTALVTILDDPDRRAVSSPFLGLVSAPGNLVGILLVLAIAALGWRRGVPVRLTAVLLVIAIAVPFSRYFLADALPFGAAQSWVYLAASGLAVLVQLGFVILPWKRRARPAEGWSGAGPGVVLLLALGIAMALSTMLIVGVGAWLSPARRENGAPELVIPGVWADFAFWLLLVLFLIVVATGILLARFLRGYPGLTTPAVDEPVGYERFALLTYGTDRPSTIPVPEPPPARVLVARRTAAILHRGEPILGFVAVLFGLALAFTAAPDVKKVFGGATAVNDFIARAPAVALTILATVAVAAIAAIASNALTTKERPLGLLWDLICFLPRAGHPFGPPCYAERVVPEVNQRIREWLSPENDPAGERRVILSAHSLGAVLATSCIFALKAQGDVPTDRIGLVTYGIQLRPYFGRFFPELLGPDVLGVRPCGPPSLLTGDPWYAQVRADETAAAVVPKENSLIDILRRKSGGGPAWQSLWRRSDFLGFPVSTYLETDNQVDRGASELDLRTYLPTIATHSHYPLSPQYLAAVEEVRVRLAGSAPPSAPGSAPTTGA